MSPPPPICRISASTGRPIQDGLTLVELVVAVPLAAGIAMMAFFAVRSIMQSARILQAATEENSALRTGLGLALNESDSWDSHANPDFPYLRAYNATDFKDNYGSLEHAANKRLFRPMQVTHSVYHTNGSDLLPGDERSWYFGPAIPGVHLHTWANINGTMQEASPIRYGKDPLVVTESMTGRVNVAREHSPLLLCIPSGWEGWHLQGDYASLSNLSRSISSLGAEDAQQALLRIYSKVGHLGVGAYASPGTLVFPLTEPVNRPDRDPANSNTSSEAFFRKSLAERKTLRWCWGEVPWSLTPDAGSLTRHAGIPSPTDGPNLPIGVDPNLTNFGLGRPSHQMAYRVEVPVIPKTWDQSAPSNTWDEEAQVSYTNDSTKSLAFVPVDYQAALNRTGGLSTICGIYPARAFYSGQGLLRYNSAGELLDDDGNTCAKSGKLPAYEPAWDSISSLDSLITNPYRLMNQTGIEWSPQFRYDKADFYYRQLEYGSLRRMEASHSLSTTIAPAIPSDPREVPDDRAPMSLRLRVLRTNLMGYDRMAARICITRGETGKVYEFEITPLGSTFRGARWYWGLRTAGSIGDSK